MVVQRGDITQYSPQGAEQSQASNLTNVIADTVMNLANTAISVNQQAQKTKIFNNMTQAQTELFQVSENLKTQYSSDPMGDEFKTKWREETGKVFEKYGQNIGKTGQREWNLKKTEVLSAYELKNAEWAINTNKDNAKTNIGIAIQNNAKLAGNYGTIGDVDSLVAMIELNHKDLFASASAVIGETQANKLLYSYASDMAKSFLSSNIKTNPTQALSLIEDDRVKKIVGDDKELADLKEAAIAQSTKQAKINQYVKTVDYLKENTNIYGKAINQELTFEEAQEFFLKNPDLPEWEKNTILEISGFRVKKGNESLEFQGNLLRKSSDIAEEKARKAEERRLTVENRRADAEERRARAEEIRTLKEISYSDLTMQGADLLEGNLNIDVDNPSKAVPQAMSEIKKYQQKLNEYYSKGFINKSEWNQLSNSYIQPMSGFLEENLSKLDEGVFATGFGVKGYKGIKQIVNNLPANSSGELTKESKIQSALLYSNFYEELEKAKADNQLNSVYDIEKLPSNKQLEIYTTAQENAIRRTKATSTNPHVWFKYDYPTEAEAIEMSLPELEAKDVMNRVGNKVYKDERLPDVPKIVEEEIKGNMIKGNKQLSKQAKGWAF